VWLVAERGEQEGRSEGSRERKNWKGQREQRESELDERREKEKVGKGKRRQKTWLKTYACFLMKKKKKK